jgi:hypothetical protein
MSLFSPLAGPHARQVGPSFGETVALLPHVWSGARNRANGKLRL